MSYIEHEVSLYTSYNMQTCKALSYEKLKEYFSNLSDYDYSYTAWYISKLNWRTKLQKVNCALSHSFPILLLKEGLIDEDKAISLIKMIRSPDKENINLAGEIMVNLFKSHKDYNHGRQYKELH